MHCLKTDIFFIIYFVLLFILPITLHSQTNPNFDFSLGIDYSAAEQMLDYFDHRHWQYKICRRASRKSTRRGNKRNARAHRKNQRRLQPAT